MGIFVRNVWFWKAVKTDWYISPHQGSPLNPQLSCLAIEPLASFMAPSTNYWYLHTRFVMNRNEIWWPYDYVVFFFPLRIHTPSSLLIKFNLLGSIIVFPWLITCRVCLVWDASQVSLVVWSLWVVGRWSLHWVHCALYTTQCDWFAYSEIVSRK